MATTADPNALKVNWSSTKRFALSALAHVLLFAFSWLLAFGLVYNFRGWGQWFPLFFVPLLPAVVAIKGLIFYAMGLYRGSWRYVSIRDCLQITWAAWLSFFCICALYYFIVNLQGVARLLGFGLDEYSAFGGADLPDTVLVLDFAGTIALVCAARLVLRLYYEEVRPPTDGRSPRLLILGAGNAGENVVREILRMPSLRYEVVGFLDDDRAKWRGQIHGVEVLGPIDQIKRYCEEYAVDDILIAMPSATRRQIRRVIELCEGTNLRFKTLPAMADLIAGKAQVQQFRDVDINDLLGRAPVTLDDAEIAKFILDRVVMVTGAGGSIGSEMCRQIARFSPRRLLLVEQAEQNLFEIDRELRGKLPKDTVIPIIADIGDQARIESVFRRERPSAVFHAAAHKHVPMMEYNPGEAVKNNVRGTRVVADAAAAAGCDKFVMISTDKAVNPTSIMGGSKRVAEMYIQGLNERVDTQFVTVRFGNVLGSSGSVVPIFREQIARGGPVTVTHPDMVRYFMTIPEAAQLVLQAASMGQGGEIFVLDMGEPVKIMDLAREMITLSGLRPDEDIEIKVTGMRPGEKLFEELSIEGEDVSRTPHPKIGIWRKRLAEWDQLVRAVDDLVSDADALSRDDLRLRIKRLVPEFHLESPALVQPAAVPAARTAARVAPTS